MSEDTALGSVACSRASFTYSHISRNRVLNLLDSSMLLVWKVMIERVTVVKFRTDTVGVKTTEKLKLVTSNFQIINN